MEGRRGTSLNNIDARMNELETFSQATSNVLFTLIELVPHHYSFSFVFFFSFFNFFFLQNKVYIYIFIYIRPFTRRRRRGRGGINCWEGEWEESKRLIWRQEQSFVFSLISNEASFAHM